MNHEIIMPNTAMGKGICLTSCGCDRLCPCSRMSHMPEGPLFLLVHRNLKGWFLLLAFRVLFCSFAKCLAPR